jgi:hypothetical protein
MSNAFILSGKKIFVFQNFAAQKFWKTVKSGYNLFMREWQLKAGDPLALNLACDIRLNSSDYCNDHIWELNLGGGEPAALAVSTTYGLRARLMRLFPRFIMGEQALSDPAEFAQPPVIHHVLPNYIHLTCQPSAGIDVSLSYWVPESHALAGRIQVVNNSAGDARMTLEWVAQLSPAAGQRMAAEEVQATTILHGQTGDLYPVVFMTGGARPNSGPYPALAVRMELAPGAERQLTWVQAALENREASFQLARSIAGLNWEAETARLEMINSRQVEVFTGDPDWDAALMLSQKAAVQLMVGPTERLPHPSFVTSRSPDMGYSPRGDGSDYAHLWNGQSPRESLYISGLLGPAAPEFAAGLLRNFLAAQTETGFIDWRPGLGGQRSKLLAPPLLAAFTWRLYESNEDIALLQEAYPALIKFIRQWFVPERDRNGDGVPEWDHAMQAGDEDHPVYSNWRSWSQGIDITTAESVGLNCFLYRECQTLIRMAKTLGQPHDQPELEAWSERMRQAVEAAWDEQAAAYFDRDRDSHLTTHPQEAASLKGSGIFLLHKTFDPPTRLTIDIGTEETARRRPTLFLHGRSASGRARVERIADEDFRWTPGSGRTTGRHIYSALERIEIHGLEPDDTVTISGVGYDYQDDSTLMPLWAGIPTPERAQRLVEETLLNPQGFWRPYGIPAGARPPQDEDAQVCASVNLLWNALIGAGLVQYGFRDQAAELVTRLMNGVIANLKRGRPFQRYFHADTSQGLGEVYALNGLAPLGLFLQTLGVQLISSTKVGINGFNPYPRPVTVKYRGLTLLCSKDRTTVIFPDGQTVAVDDPRPQIVALA